jgi:CheY-like chemotaxis protein
MVRTTGRYRARHLEPRAPAPTPEGALPRPLVLIVDDDPAVREMLALSLTRLGIVTVGAANGLDAFTLARRLAPDAIVTDLSVPGLDGMGLIGRLRDAPWGRRVPIVVFSGQERGVPSKALDHPGVVLMSKETGPGPVLALLASILGREDAAGRIGR